MKANTSIKRALRIIALIAFGLAFIALTASPAAAQGFSVSFGQREFIVSPGDRFTGTIPVTNITDEPVVLRIYLGDWLRIPGSTEGYVIDEERGNEVRSFVDWMIFSPERMTLETEETRDVNWEINVPEDRTLEGSYWGVIIIERIPEEEPDIEVAEGETVIGITTIWRYAIQIFSTIEGTEIREATFTSFSMEQAEGGFDAVAVLENRGNIYMKPDVWLEMTDIAGEVVYGQEHKERTVLPASAREFEFELRDLPIESGEYMIMIYADYGVPTLIAAQGRVNYTYTPPPEPVEEEPEEVEEPAEPEDEPVVEEPVESE